jgi:hypothetical protein
VGVDLIVLEPAAANAEIQLETLVVVHQTELQLLTVGEQGPAGPPGLSGSAPPGVPFGFGDASPSLVHTFAASAMLATLQLVIEEPFDGVGAALRLRTDDGLVLMEADQNAPGIPAMFETTPATQLPAGTAIYLEINPGAGATTGAGQVLLNLH